MEHAAPTGICWDPDQYLRFTGERSRPFRDLLAQVGATDPGYVVDLGCGPGNQTATLSERWPAAQVLGVDSSPEMIAQADAGAVPGRLEFGLGDVREWAPTRPVDVLISNATLQWVPGHLDLFGRFVDALSPGGWFAFQVPGNFHGPSHLLLTALAATPRWRDRLSATVAAGPAVREPEEYLEALVGLGTRATVWETTYLYVLAGPDPVLEWMKGTGLRPVLSVLDEADTEEFLSAYGAALREEFPRRPFGTVLPYRRIFAVARKDGPGDASA